MLHASNISPSSRYQSLDVEGRADKPLGTACLTVLAPACLFKCRVRVYCNYFNYKCVLINIVYFVV